MLTHHIEKHRHEKTLIGSFQSKWKKAFKKMDKTSLNSMSIALSTIMILGTLALLLSFINMQNPQMPKQRKLKSGHAAELAQRPAMWDGEILTERTRAATPHANETPSADDDPHNQPQDRHATKLPRSHSAPAVMEGHTDALPQSTPTFSVKFSTNWLTKGEELSVNSVLLDIDDDELKEMLQDQRFKTITAAEMRKLSGGRRGSAASIWCESKLKRRIEKRLYKILQVLTNNAYKFEWANEESGYTVANRTGIFTCTCKPKED